MSKILRLTIVLLALAGIGSSIYLTLIHYWHLVDPSYQSICSVSQTFDCDKVNTSEYSVFLGVPIALYGVAFYLVILTLTLMSFSTGEKLARALDLVFGLSTLSFLLSVALALVSEFKVGAFCLFCISLYVINTLLMLISFKAAGGGLRAVVGRLDSELAGFYRSPLAYTAFLIFLGVSFLGGGFYREKMAQAQEELASRVRVDLAKEKKEAARAGDPSVTEHPKEPEAPAADSLFDPPMDLPLNGYEPIRGKADAPVKIYAWSDFECPHCKIAAGVLDEVVARMPGQVAQVYKQYPLDMSCNEYVQRPMHERACAASIASMCAQRQGLFWEMHDLIFRNQDRLSDDDIASYARNIGMDMNAFNQCLQDRDIVLELNKDIEQGKVAGVAGTPSLYFNGRRYKGPPIAEVMAQAVQVLLSDSARGGAKDAKTASASEPTGKAGSEKAAPPPVTK